MNHNKLLPIKFLIMKILLDLNEDYLCKELRGTIISC